MSDEGKPRRTTPRLPASGLADEILDQLARGEMDAEADPQGTEDAAAEPRDVDRIYTFTDSLQLGRQEEEEREVYETWVEFRLAGELFALPVGVVREILRVREVTPVPQPPFPVIGVINLRSRVVPLLDLRARLALPAPSPDAESRIVVVESEARRIGLLVDAVERVARLAQSDMRPTEEPDADEIQALHTQDGRETRLLDLDAILTSRD